MLEDQVDLPRLSLIVAVADNGVIGRDNQLPWRLPRDLQYFKQRTLGRPIIMGRHTVESLLKPLPGRVNIGVSSQAAVSEKAEIKAISAVNGETVWLPSLLQAIELANIIALRDKVDEIFVIGGAQLYEAALPLVDRLYLTRVHASPEGDVLFPSFDRDEWLLLSGEFSAADEANQYDVTFEVYERA